MRASLRDVALILLTLETMVMLLLPLAIVIASALGVRWLRCKLPPLFAQARKILAQVRLNVNRASAAVVAPLIGMYALVAQVRAWMNFLFGLTKEEI